jgi:hypothetical protein
LLRHETANDDHYSKLHPANLSLQNRKRCLQDLKAIGYQVGAGFMVGSPYLRQVADWAAAFLNANASAYRPILDIHHIQLFLLAEVFRNANRVDEFAAYAGNLQVRLYLRRLSASQLPFLDATNSLKNVFEQVAMSPIDSVVLTKSSYFLMCLLELCCLLSPEKRDPLLASIHRRLVLGAMDDGSGEPNPIDLISWIPPDDWATKVFAETVQDGEAVSVHQLSQEPDATAADLSAALDRIVSEMRKVHTFTAPANIPLSALLLGCLRFESPVPPELWRRNAFPSGKQD